MSNYEKLIKLDKQQQNLEDLYNYIDNFAGTKKLPETVIGFLERVNKRIDNEQAKVIYTFNDLYKIVRKADDRRNARIKHERSKAEAKQKQTNELPEGDPRPKMGAIFAYTFHYTMTQPSFFQVVGYKGKLTVVLRELKMRIVESNDGGWTGTKEPIINDFMKGEPVTGKIQVTNVGDNFLRGTFGYPYTINLKLWDGKPRHFDSLD